MAAEVVSRLGLVRGGGYPPALSILGDSLAGFAGRHL